MNGRVVAVLVAVGERVAAGQPIVTLEAMKMEHVHAAPVAGTVKALHVPTGDQVAASRVVAEIDAAAAEPAAGRLNAATARTLRTHKETSMSDPAAAVLHDKRGHAFWITINRPDKRNAINTDVIAGIRDGYRAAHADADVRVIVLTGRRRQGVLRRRRPAARQGLRLRLSRSPTSTTPT